MKRHYYFKGVFIVLIPMLIFSTACAYGAEESITLTTYYPSPYGVYSEMRLYPKGDATCNNQQEGLMYYDNNPPSERGLKICGETAPGVYGWLPLGGYWAPAPSNSNNIYSTNPGNVGIGTNNPSYKLHIIGDVGWSGTLQTGWVPWQRLNSFPGSCPVGEYIWDIRTGACSAPPVGPGGSTGSLTVTGAGGSMSPNPWSPGSGLNATLDIPGGPGGGSVFSLTGGSGITLSGPGVSGNTWNPNAGTATISSSGGGGGGALGAWSGMLQANVVYTAATDGFVTATSSEGGDEDCNMKIETPVGIIRQVSSPNHDGVQIALASPVRKGDTWQVRYGGGCGSVGNEVRIYWIPLGS